MATSSHGLFTENTLKHLWLAPPASLPPLYLNTQPFNFSYVLPPCSLLLTACPSLPIATISSKSPAPLL